MDERIHQSMVLRLARYLRVLQQLKSLGFVKVFSNNLGDAIGATPAVVRKDFSVIGVSGNKRGGYVIDALIERLVTVLGKSEIEEIVVVGCGRIGTALLNYREFAREGIHVAAGFDADEKRTDPNAPIPVLPMVKLPDFVKENDISVAVLATPDQVASHVFEILLDAGIRGILNFTSVELKCSSACPEYGCAEECTVHNVDIGLEIETLFHLIRLKRATRERQEAAAEEA